MSNPTHRLVKVPTLGLRYLADFMAASKRGERNIIQGSKYRSTARVIQHSEARSTVSKFILDPDGSVEWLKEEAIRLRDRLCDNDFERELYDNNADYIDHYADIAGAVNFPKAEMLIPGPSNHIMIHGVRVTIGFHFRLRRVSKNNKLREGAGMLRYAKGKRLSPETAAYQSAFIFGYLGEASVDQSIEPDKNLCITLDAHAGLCHPAPGNSVTRYANMKAACATIADAWDNIKPPKGAIL